MRPVNIARFKAEMGRYLRAVRKGEELVLLDRDRPIAKIVPFAGTSAPALRVRKAIASGGPSRLEVPPYRGRPVDTLAVLLEDRARR